MLQYRGKHLKKSGVLVGLTFAADIRQYVGSKSLAIIGVSAGLIFLVLIASSHLNKKGDEYKKYLFLALALIVLIGTSSITTLNLYLYSKSEVRGIVNWQAGIEFWVCDTEIEIRSSDKFFDKRIGSASVYENNDKRIHINGIVLDKSTDANLGTFMRNIGGGISANMMSLPVDKKIVEDTIDGDVSDAGGVSNVIKFIKEDSSGNKTMTLKNGMNCSDNTPGELQVFVYTSGDELYSQTKLSDPGKYVIKNSRNVPPGDCVIVEFGKPKDRSDRLCKEYGELDASRCHEFGVPLDKSKVCKLNEVQQQRGKL